MKRLVTILSVLATTSTIAIAQPRPYDRERDRGVDEAPRYGEMYHSNWVLLGEGFSTEYGRQDLELGRRAGAFRRVNIKAERGHPYIRRVIVEFGNGEREAVRVDQELEPGHSYTFDLPGDFRQIRRVEVITAPDRWSRYAVYGM